MNATSTAVLLSFNEGLAMLFLSASFLVVILILIYLFYPAKKIEIIN